MVHSTKQINDLQVGSARIRQGIIREKVCLKFGQCKECETVMCWMMGEVEANKYHSSASSTYILALPLGRSYCLDIVS